MEAESKAVLDITSNQRLYTCFQRRNRHEDRCTNPKVDYIKGKNTDL